MPDSYPSDPYETTGRTILANTVIRNIGQLVTVAQAPLAGASGPLQVLEHAALAIHKGVIVWVGKDDGQETRFVRDATADQNGIKIIDAQGAVVTP
ncbi:MAG: hypothetical protein E6J34_20170, partial [Chloroflexi bacterium]